MTERFAIIPVPDSHPPPPEAIVIGSLAEVMGCISLSDTAQRLMDAEERLSNEKQQLVQLAQKLVGVVPHIENLIDTEEALETERIDKETEQARRDEEETERQEQKELQEYLDSLPDPDNPDAPAAYHPGGELHSIAAKDQDPQGIIPDPRDPEGAVLDQGLEGLVTKRPVVDPAELAHPETPAQRNPVAISLNEG
jgi:hypothetical protein